MFFEGLLYVPDDADVSFTKDSFKNLKLAGNVVKEPYDLNSQGMGSYARFHQLPVNAVIVQIDGVPVAPSSDIKQAISD